MYETVCLLRGANWIFSTLHINFSIKSVNPEILLAPQKVCVGEVFEYSESHKTYEDKRQYGRIANLLFSRYT